MEDSFSLPQSERLLTTSQSLTNLSLDAIIGGFSTEYERRVIENTNTTKYQIDGKPAGAFTYVEDRKDLNFTETNPTVMQGLAMCP
jgi:hypothetical protein